MIALSTDAPIYHRPYGTVLLMVLSVVAYCYCPPESLLNIQIPVQFQGEGPPVEPAADSAWEFRLEPGSFNPVQWITSPLLHDGVGQLIVSVIGLWALGLVVEGKIGLLKFLTLFMGLAVGQAALFQVLLLASYGRPFGGLEPAIVSLLGLAVIWAPKNCLEVWFGPFIGLHDIPILIYGFIDLALSLILGSFGSIVGLVFGLALGFVWLRLEWVDCEGWDLFSVLKNEHENPNPTEEEEETEREAKELVRGSLGSDAQRKVAARKRARKEAKATQANDEIEAKQNAAPAGDLLGRLTGKRAKREEAPVEEVVLSFEERMERVQDNVEELILDGNSDTALKMMKKLERGGTPIELSQPALAKLLRDLSAAQEYSLAIPFMEQHIRRFDVKRTTLRMNLAKIHLHMERPKKALAVLRELDRAQLDESETAKFGKIVAVAKKQIDEGVIEISED